ncbi:hypothetical protein IP90_02079 [Luteimonas cucumeris]|uniref:4-amino-4-deoxy-L-arabinose transferase-like glycosyltransferase n=1 Tax=Luteimonas cucumeris TaxID=985012 RepID=A0A562L5M0_9GAMM|nr:hypothetical protein [Luteimonas cucumeris]TWI02977.1 hypothetical protein IP90_02079 [Luteimonas cucumeris]
MKNSLRYIKNLLPALIMLTLLVGFFERPVLFHDEIINVSQAQKPVIFNYAARPMFYLLDYMGVSFLGDHPLALSFIMLLVSIVGAWFTYLFAKRYYGYSAGLAALSAYCWLGWVYASGISAMPHMLPATLAILALYLYTPRRVEGFGWSGRLGLSLLLWAMLLSHPTGVAYFIPFFCFIGFDLVQARLDKRISSRELLQIGLSWALISLAIWLMIEACYGLFSENDVSYAGSWLAGLDKTSDGTYSRYFQPYNYYFELFATRFQVLIIALLAAIGCLVASWLGDRRASLHDGRGERMDGTGAIAIRLMVYSLLALCVLSTQSWKFERVAATFAPVASLALVCLIFEVLGRVRWKTRFLKPVFGAMIVILSAYSFAHEVDRISGSLERRRGTYSSFMEAIRAAETDQVAYVGSSSGFRLADMPTSATGRRLQHAGSPPDTAAEAEALAKRLRKEGHDHVLIEVGEDGRASYPLRRYLYESRMQRLASYRRGTYELWSLAPLNIRPPAYVIDDVKTALAKKLGVFLRYDRVVRGDRQDERQVYLEILGADIDQTDKAVAAVFESLGYSMRRGLRDSNGIRVKVQIRGEPPINVLIRDKQASPPFRRAEGSASVYLRQTVD